MITLDDILKLRYREAIVVDATDLTVLFDGDNAPERWRAFAAWAGANHIIIQAQSTRRWSATCVDGKVRLTPE